MSADTKESKREYLREYTKKRHENPEIHEQDKERSRKYVTERRKDPAYRMMENLRRAERRKRQREQLLLGASNSAINSRPRKSMVPKTSSLKCRTTEALIKLEESPPLSNHPTTRKSSTRLSQRDQRALLEEQEEFVIAEIDSENHQNSESDSSYQITVSSSDQPLAPHSIVEIVTSPVVALPNNRATIRQNGGGSVSLTDLPPACNCSRSLALSKLSAMSLAMPFHERQRFESGLLQFAEDFMGAEPQDPFTMLICDKLKRVPADEKPDLEVAILKTINDSLKRKKEI